MQPPRLPVFSRRPGVQEARFTGPAAQLWVVHICLPHMVPGTALRASGGPVLQRGHFEGEAGGRGSNLTCILSLLHHPA